MATNIDGFLDGDRESAKGATSSIDSFLAPKKRSILESAGDSALALTTGLAQGAQMLSNVAGADNPVAQRFGGIADSLRERESPYRQAQREARGEKIRQAEESGSTWEEIKAYAGAFADAPVDTTLEALGTTAPTLGAALLTGGKSAAAQIASRAVPAAIGAAQGTGAVKGEIYEAVENRWLDAGATPEEAAARAAQSQAYGGDNTGSIAVGTGLGALAASIGVEAAARRLAAPWMTGRAATHASPSILRSTAAGVAREAPIEAVQGGQERLAANLAVQGEGFDQRTWQGVAGQGTLEGLASAPLGGGFGAAEGAAARRAFRASQPSASPEQEIAGLLPSPVQTGTPSDQILQADTARANAVAEAEARTAEIARRRAEFEAQRAPTPSEQMGLNPADGPMSEAAALAVDTGAVAGLLPAPVYQGTPSDQILQADIERANAVAQAEARAAEIARRRQEFEAGRAPDSPANKWQSMSADERRAMLLDAGNWTTQKGDLSVVGKRMVQADWNRINENARQTIEARMSHAKPVTPEDRIEDAAHEAATSPLNNLPEPTEAQKEAGNYAKGHIRLQGLEITVENPRGSDRTGKRPDGSEWRHTMSDHYGYIRRTNGADGEQIDVYVGPEPDSPRVFVVDQIDQQTGRFDEHKAMLGFPDEATAVAAYSSNFDPGWQVGPVRSMSMDEFKTWLDEGDTTKPAVGVKGRQAQATQDLLQRAEPRLDDLRAMSQEAGWAERGGLMLRGPDGEVTGRTPWIPRAEWFRAGMENQPETLAADIDKMARGEPAPAKSRRTIEGMIEWLDAQQAGVRLAPEDMSSYELEVMGYESDPAPVQSRYDVADDFLSDNRAPQDTAAQMRALGFTEQEIANELRREAEAGTGSRGERDAGRTETSGRNDLDPQPGEAGAGRAETQQEGLTLDSYTPAELAQREAAQREAEQTEANQQREIEQRRQADAERGDFTLTGSDRDADVAAARGQGGLFDRPAARADSAPAAQPETETISDLGEKIGGARKDTAQPVGRRATRAQSDERPAWARRFQIGQVVSQGRDKGKWNISDSRSKDRFGNARRVAGPFDTQEEAEAALPLAAVSRKHRVVSAGRGDERSFEIWRDVTDRKRVKVVNRSFESREEALAYMAENAASIMEANTTFGEADLPVPANKQRIGAARRDGDVTGNDFMSTFGFRGVEFGNWNNQAERQEVMNEAYDGLLDLAEAMDIPPKAISLNGDLALAFGARGHGLTGARAHYERNKAVINLTKMNGAGALAHEWFHALDHYFGRQDGKASSQWEIDADGTRSLPADMGSGNDYVTSGFSVGQRSGVRPEVRAAYESLMNTIFRKAETYVEDTTKADKFVGAAKADVQHHVDQIRKDLAEPKDPRYWKRNNKAAPAELLAEFDTLAQQIVEGFSLETTFKRVEGAKSRSPLAAFRETNDTLDRISEIYKKVRGRTGFTADRSGVLDRMRNAMVRYNQRLKMLADAQNSTEKTKQVPTDFAMDAKSLDQGRGTDYWSTPHEMGARAFQAYVEDRIAAGGGRSPFLNYGPENAAIETPWGWKRPYPAGKERQAINAAIENLTGTLETRETESGTALFSFAGREAETASRHTLNDAQQRIATGEDAEAVRQDTGWHRGPDGMWRFEISDEQARLEVGGNIASEVLEAAALDRADVRVVDVLHHPQLFAAYPHLENIRVELMPAGERAAARLVRSIAGQKMQVRGDLKRQALVSVMLHELQHAIQHAEGFATGGSRKALVSDMDKTGAETYRRLAGEVEARNTQSRQRMTDEQRRQIAPEDTADVAASDVIVTFNGEPVKAAPANAGARVPVTERGLLRALHYQFRGLVEPVRAMLERGRRGQKGGLVVIDSADPLRVAVTFSSKTGRPLSNSIELFSEAGQINGFFDPSSGLTFLIGPNLDPITAPAVLLHEMSHGQQRQKIDAQAMSMLMNRAQEKDADTRAFLDRVADRMIDAEATADSREAAAYIVEQAVIEGRSQGYRVADSRFFDWADSAFGKKVGDFLRSVAAMVRTWMIRHGGIKALTIDDLVGYAMVGVERAARGAVDGKSKSVSASEGRGKKSVFTPDAYDVQQFASAVDRIAAAENAPRTDLTVGDTPAVLRALGAKALPIQMPSSMIHKASRPAIRGHDVPVAVLRNLPALIADPVMVFDSRTEHGAMVALVDARDDSGRPVVVAVHMDAKGGGFHNINKIASIYGKDDIADIERWMAGSLRYYQKEKAPRWLRAVGLQLPEANTIKRLNSRVITDADIVNRPDVSFSRSGATPPRTADAFPELNADQRAFLNKVGTPPAQVRASEWVKARFERIGTKIRQGLVDRYAALKEMDEKLHGKDFIDTAITDSAWVLARMSSAASGAMSAMMSGGRIAFDRNQRVVTMKDGDASGGLTAVLQKLGSPSEVERFFAWVAANRAEKLMAEGRENLFTADEIAAGKTLNTGKTESGAVRPMLYTQVFREFQQYRDDVLSIAEQTGIISAENRAMWRDEFYVPFYRVMEEEQTTGPMSSKGLSRQEAYKKLKGGRENLNDLLENTLMNFHHLIAASLKNQAAVQAMKNAEKLGIAQKVSESGRDPKTSTFVLEDGKRVFYQVDDPIVFDSLTALSDPGLNNMAVRTMGAFKRLLTNMVTVTPQFIIANTMRDLMQATATTPTSKNVAKNLVQGIGTFRDAKTRAEMLASGAGFSFGHLYGADVDEVKSSLNRTLKGSQLVTDVSMIPKILRAGWQAWGNVTDTSENIARAATYKQNVETLGRLRAAYEARDIMDFSQHGSWPAIRFLIRTVPFLNARMQGLDKIYRSGVQPAFMVATGKGTEADRQAAARFGAVTGALTLATIALYLANYEDEEYRKLEDWQKDTYWFFRIGDNAFFLPKPFEVGAIATMAERIAEQMIDDKATGKLFRERMQDMFMQTFSFNPVPQMFQPVLDVYSNRDAFTGRAIETPGMERLSVGMRARDTTTAPARAVSAVSRVFGDESPIAISPVQADHLIRGYFGTVGANAVGIMDTMWRGASGQESPDKRFSEYQPIRRFYRDLGAPAPYTRYSTLFYDGLREANRVYADVRELQALGRQSEAAQLAAEQRNMLALRTTLNRQQRRLSEINNQIKMVRRSDRDGAWKRRELDRLNAIKGAITENVGKRIEMVQAAG